MDRTMVKGHGVMVGLRPHLEEEAGREGRRVLARVRALCRKMRVPYAETLTAGEVGAEILRTAKRVRAQLIVMGTRGLGQVGTLLLGSRAMDVVTGAHCPVLLVRYGTARRVRTPAPRGKRR